MKKNSLVAIQTLLTDLINDDPANGAEYGDILEEITAELNRGEKQKAENAAMYESIHDMVMETLSDTPVTLAELWEAIETDVPTGVTKGKLQYAVTRLWKDEITKVDGNPNGYCRKA